MRSTNETLEGVPTPLSCALARVARGRAQRMSNVVVTETHVGRRIPVRVDDTVEIRLAENTAAGYAWSVSAIDRTRLQVTSSRHEPSNVPAANDGNLDAIGTRVVLVMAFTQGLARVELVKARAGAVTGSDGRRFSIEIDIRPSPRGRLS